MSRLILVLVVCTGCHTFNTPGEEAQPVNTGDRVLSGLPSEVHKRVGKAFESAGVSGGACGAWMDEKGEGMSVIGQTKDGRMFRVILQQSGRSTRASVTWDQEPDEEMGRKILAGL